MRLNMFGTRTLAGGGGGCCAMPGWRPMACTACMACIICIACIWLIGSGCPWWCPPLGGIICMGCAEPGPTMGIPGIIPCIGMPGRIL